MKTGSPVTVLTGLAAADGLGPTTIPGRRFRVGAAGVGLELGATAETGAEGIGGGGAGAATVAGTSAVLAAGGGGGFAVCAAVSGRPFP